MSPGRDRRNGASRISAYWSQSAAGHRPREREVRRRRFEIFQYRQVLVRLRQRDWGLEPRDRPLAPHGPARGDGAARALDPRGLAVAGGAAAKTRRSPPGSSRRAEPDDLERRAASDTGGSGARRPSNRHTIVSRSHWHWPHDSNFLGETGALQWADLSFPQLQ